MEGSVDSPVDLGTVRELFFVQSVMNSGVEAHHAKAGDYDIQKNTFEVGGKNKAAKQVKGIQTLFLVKDNIAVSSVYEIPLIVFGFLYEQAAAL